MIALRPFLRVLGVAGVLVPAVLGQNWGYGHSSKVKVADEPGREPLEIARRAIETGEVERALEVYQDILDRLPDRVVQVFSAQRTGNETDSILTNDRFAGLRDHVQNLIRALPPKTLERYREREDRRAETEFTLARRVRDEAALRRVVTSRYLTHSGPPALAALADVLFEDGRIDEARMHAQRLVASLDPASDQGSLRSRALLRGAFALALLSRRAELLALRAGMGDADSTLEVTYRGVKSTVGSIVADLLKDLPPEPKTPPGDRSLSAFNTRPWAPHAIYRSDEFGDERFRSISSAGYYPVHPVATDSAIYICDGVKIEALSLMTGAPLWPAVLGPEPYLQGRRNWSVIHQPVLDRGTIYACLEDEPERKKEVKQVFHFTPVETIAVRKLYAVDAQTGTVRWTHSQIEGSRDQDERAFLNRVSINTPPLVIGERLYVGATHYLGGFRHWLCAFDKDTGRLVWKTYIGQGQAELNMFGNPVKEVVPGLVGESNGVLVYSTNIGVVAAIDATTGAPRWFTAYEQELVPPNDGQRTNERAPSWVVHRPQFHKNRVFLAPSDSPHLYMLDMEGGEGRPVPLASRTTENQFRHVVGVHEGLLIVSGKRIAAFDVEALATGGDGFRWLATPESSAGWDSPGVDGCPAILGDLLVYCNRYGGAYGQRTNAQSRVAAIEVRTGRHVGQKLLQNVEVAGNLTPAGDAIVVTGREGVSAFFDMGAVAKRLEAELQSSESNPALHLRLGQIRLQEMNLDLAVAAFERARELALSRGAGEEETAGAATQALYTIMLKLAGETVRGPHIPPTVVDRFKRALSFAATQQQQVHVLYREMIYARDSSQAALLREVASRILSEFPDEMIRVEVEINASVPELLPGLDVRAGLVASLVAGAYLAPSLPADAVTLYAEALRRFPDEPIATVSGSGSTVWRFSYEKIAAILKSAGRDVYSAEEKAAEKLFAEGRQNDDVDSFRAILDRYPNASIVEKAYLELSTRLRAARRDREALQAVQKQLARFGMATAPLVAELARSLESAGCIESAREVLIALKQRFATEKIATEPGPVEGAAFADERLATAPFQAVMAALPQPELPLGSQIKWVERPQNAGEEVTLIVPTGRRPAVAESYILVIHDGELRALDTDTGAPRWTKPVRAIADVNPLWKDDRLILVADGDLVAIQPKDGTESWRTSCGRARILALHAAHGKVYLMLREPAAPRALIIRACDIVTGDRLGSDVVFSGPMAAVDQSLMTSLTSSPLWLLARVDTSPGTSLVLDGITGEVKGQIQATGRNEFLPILTADDMLVSAGGTSGTTLRNIQVTAQDPATRQRTWTYKFDGVQSLATVAVTPTLAAVAVRYGSANAARRSLVVLNLATGTTKMEARIDPLEVAYGGLVSGDVLFVVFGRMDTPPKRFTRAYDLKKGVHMWDSQSYSSGGGINMGIHVGRDLCMLRINAKDNAKDPATDRRVDRIQVLEIRTGLLKDSITLDNTALRPAPDIELRDRTLVIRSGPEVSVRK